MIVDRDKVVAVAGDLKKKYLDKSISSKLDNIIEQREVVLEPKLRDFNFIEDKKETASYAISPIIVSGDAIGAVIIFSFFSSFKFINVCVAITSPHINYI